MCVFNDAGESLEVEERFENSEAKNIRECIVLINEIDLQCGGRSRNQIEKARQGL